MGSCAATNQDGSPCSNDAVEGSKYCHVHQPDGWASSGQGGEGEHGFLTLLAGAMTTFFLVYFLYRLFAG